MQHKLFDTPVQEKKGEIELWELQGNKIYESHYEVVGKGEREGIETNGKIQTSIQEKKGEIELWELQGYKIDQSYYEVVGEGDRDEIETNGEDQ